MQYALYFIIGGTVVSVSTWAGSLGRSWLAAFVSTLPTLTVLTFVLIYQNAGAAPTVPYAKNLLYFVLPWVAYVGFYILTVERFGFWVALIGSVAIFVGIAALTKFLM
ncbi:MAG: DUF3147 domain-containing protein [Nitrospiraceae bacterium]|nr:MAG: DUF3147 domain-containing protein [Nitrospiraceae bacterium]